MSAAGCIEITGQPIKEVVFTPGGVPAKIDPNGKYQVEQMYVQYFLPQNRKGKLPLLMWHGGGLTGVTYETKPDGGEGWLTYFIRKGWDTYISDAMERGRSGWTNTFKGEPMFLPFGDPWERFRIGPAGSWNDDKAKRATYPGTQFPVEAYEQFMKQGVPRWLTTDDADRRRLYRAGRQGLPVRGAGAQPVRHVRLQGAGSAARQGQGAGGGRADARRRARQGGVDQEHADPRGLSATMPRIIRAGRRSARAASTMPAFSRPPAAASMSSICRTPASRAIRTW